MSNINKIKLSGTTYNLEDLNATKTVELTQAQYDALAVKDPNTFYVITDAEGADLSQYYTSAQTESAITQAVSGKQDTLSAGTNITIVDNVISATGGGGGGKAVSGGTNISITTGETADTINCTLPISADSKGIYTTSTYPFLSTSNKSGNVVFGYNNSLDTFGSSRYSSNNLFFGSNNRITVNGSGMLIGGSNNENNGNYTNMSACVVLGSHNRVGNPNEFASGSNNLTHYSSDTFGSSGNTLFSVGNGTADNARHNAFEIRQNGDIYCSDGTNDVKLQDTITATAANTTALGGLKLVKLSQSEYDALSPNYDSNTLYVIVN